MKLEYYREIHPKWEVVSSFTEKQSEAAVDLLLLTAFIDDDLADDELDMLAQEWSKLPFDYPVDTEAELKEELSGTHRYLQKILDNPDLLDEFLNVTCDIFDTEDRQSALLRLIMIEVVSDGAVDEREFELCYAIGHKLDFSFDTTEQLLESIWASHQKARDIAAGREHHVPPLKGADWARNRSESSYPNPFEMRTKA